VARAVSAVTNEPTSALPPRRSPIRTVTDISPNRAAEMPAKATAVRRLRSSDA
jgi:hypothetical protein